MAEPSPSAILEIDHLRSFLAVAETGAVTAAAARVGRTPAAISMQLKKLEETLGATLFERSTKGMALNREGERLLSHARRLLRLHQEALSDFRGPALAGEVRVGLIDDFGGTRLAEALAAFARTHPGVTVTVTMGPTERLHKAMLAGELDITALTPGCAVPWLPSDRNIYEEPLVWAGALGGCAVEQDPLPVALAASGCAWRRDAIEALEQTGRAFRVAYTSEFYEAQKAAVMADLAIAPLPCSLVQPPFQVLGPAHGLPTLGACRIAIRLGPEASPAAKALCDHFADSYRPSRHRMAEIA